MAPREITMELRLNPKVRTWLCTFFDQLKAELAEATDHDTREKILCEAIVAMSAELLLSTTRVK